MDKLCKSPLWNTSSFWESDNPYLSRCFQHLILVIGSCGVLWVLAPFEFIKICKHRAPPTPWTTVSVVKMTLKVFLLIISIAEVAKSAYDYVVSPDPGLDGLVSSIIFLFTIILTIILTLTCKRHGLRVSMVLPSFWMISSVTTLVSIYNDIQLLSKDNWVTVQSLVDDGLVFLISLLQLALSSIPDRPSRFQRSQLMGFCPLEDSSLLSRLTFTWLLGLIMKSERNSLHHDHLVPLCHEMRSSLVTQELMQTSSFQKREMDEPYSSRSGNHSDEDTRNREEAEFKKQNFQLRTYLFTVLVKLSWKFLLISAVLELSYSALYLLPGYILSVILGSWEARLEWHIYIYSVALFAVLLTTNIIESQEKYYSLMAATKAKSSVMNAIYMKTLKLCRHTPVEDVKKCVLEEVDNIFQMVCVSSNVWGEIIRIISILWLLWTFIGSACFIGIVVAILLIPLRLLGEQWASGFQMARKNAKDQRLGIFAESLRGIKSLKFHAWEEFFIRKILLLRNNEVGALRKAEYLRICCTFLQTTSVHLVFLAMFAAYVLMGNAIEAENIFVSFFLIYLFKTSFTNALYVLSCFIQGLASVKRIEIFLKHEEVCAMVDSEPMPGECLSLVNAYFSSKDSTSLDNLNLNIRQGSLVIIVGEKHSGKFLLQSLLGEIKKLDGSVSIKGRIAFVGEDPWILSTTLENNILFYKPKDEERFQSTLEACLLEVAVDCLPAGEETEIGNRGIHLTYENEMKLNLARAVYRNSDIYMIEDIWNDLDVFQAEHLFNRIFSKTGILKEKTRIIMTSKIEFLHAADHIVFMENGCITEQGRYMELLQNCGRLAEYVKSQGTTSSSHCAEINCHQERIFDNFKEQSDPWYFTSGISTKSEQESPVNNEDVISSKELHSRLADYAATIGYAFFALSFLAGGIVCFCGVAGGVWLSNITESPKKAKHMYNVEIYVVFVTAQVFAVVICGILLYTGSTLGLEKLFKCLLYAIMRAPQLIFDTMPAQKIMQSFNGDLEFVDERIPRILYLWLLSVFKIMAILIIVSLVTPFAVLCYIPLLFVVCIIQRYYSSSWRQLKYLTVATSCPLAVFLDDSVHGLSNIRAYEVQRRFLNTFQKKFDTHINCCLLSFLDTRWVTSSLNITGAFFVVLTAIFCTLQRDKEVGLIGLALVYSLQMSESLIVFAHITTLLEADIMAFERIKLFSQIKQEAEWDEPSNKPPDSWPNVGEIRIENLNTCYTEGLYPDTFHNLNVILGPREKIAIISNDECSRCTLLYTLFRLIEPAGGRIIVDNIDIAQIGLHDLRARLGIVPQDIFIFNGTIRENLDPFNMFQEEMLWEAVEEADLKGYISSLDVSIDENLSLEKKYRISIARCILRKPTIVIIEEPKNTHPTEYKSFKNSTVITFSSQLIPSHYDRIIKISSGQITEDRPCIQSS